MRILAALLRPFDLLLDFVLPGRCGRRRGLKVSPINARDLLRRLVVPFAVLKRVEATPPLKGSSMVARRRTASGAFRENLKAQLNRWSVILVDDVLATGSRAKACARARGARMVRQR